MKSKSPDLSSPGELLYVLLLTFTSTYLLVSVPALAGVYFTRRSSPAQLWRERLPPVPAHYAAAASLPPSLSPSLPRSLLPSLLLFLPPSLSLITSLPHSLAFTLPPRLSLSLSCFYLFAAPLPRLRPTVTVGASISLSRSLSPSVSPSNFILSGCRALQTARALRS